MKLSAIAIAASMLCSTLTAGAYDPDRPEGFVTCTSLSSGGDYDLTGGGDGAVIVLRSDGADMRDKIFDAVRSHDVIVFDGSKGDFELSSYMSFSSLSGKTLVGVNGARLFTTFTVSQEIRDLLDALDINSYSSNPDDNLGGTLSNGVAVNEQCEFLLRQALIDHFGDPKEPYRYAGVFSFTGCENIIIRNLDFAGPGSLDVGGADLLTLIGCNNIWVDHCRFTDGLDGNLDIVSNSDFITVSDCHFRYTELAYNHPLSNLTGGPELTDGSAQKNNISWIRCFWDEGCRGRMPYATLGTYHLLNCYWDCTKGTCIDAHNKARILIEQSYFTSKIGKALALRDGNEKYEWRGSQWQGKPAQQGNAVINMPYEYTAVPMADVATLIKSSGATLGDAFSRALASSPSAVDFGTVYAGVEVEGQFNISSFGTATPASVTLTAPEGVLLSLNREGDYSSSLKVDATDEFLLQADVYFKANFTGSGRIEFPVVVTSGDESFFIPIVADVVALDGEHFDATLSWPLDRGTSSSTEATSTCPEAFTSASFTLGDKLQIHSSKTFGGETFTLFNPTDAIDRAIDRDCNITFDIVTAPGYIFVPKTLTFNASRIGTDMCYIDVECSRDGAEPQKLLAGFQPLRGNDYSQVTLPLVNAGTGETLRVGIYLYYMTANKQLALSDVKIIGDAYAADSSLDLISTDDSATPAEYYDLLGRRVINPRPGHLYITPTGLTIYR